MMLTDLLSLSDVPRWSIIPMRDKGNVAMHSHRVASIVLHLGARVNMPSALLGQAVMWAIIHDAPESHTGDIPGNFKRDYLKRVIPSTDPGSYRNVLEQGEFQRCRWFEDKAGKVPRPILLLVKLADQIETITWCIDQCNHLRVGDHIVDTERQYLKETCAQLDSLLGFYQPQSGWLALAQETANFITSRIDHPATALPPEQLAERPKPPMPPDDPVDLQAAREEAARHRGSAPTSPVD